MALTVTRKWLLEIFRNRLHQIGPFCLAELDGANTNSDQRQQQIPKQFNRSEYEIIEHNPMF